MKKIENFEKIVTCESDPCEEKTQFKIIAPNFRDLEQAGDCAGTVTAFGMAVAKKQAEFDNKILNKEIPEDSILDLNEDEQKALVTLGHWVRDRNTAIVLRCLKGADDLEFKEQKDVEDYLLHLTPSDFVRDVIDELAGKIFELSKGSKKKSD